jgi:dienelactone hydrolase
MRADRRGQAVFAAAVGVILLHVVIDAFIALEPGVRRADHLVPALVPAAILVSAVFLYPRVRPGLRAVMALAIGALAAVVGVLALGDAAGPGPAGDDWTGMLLLPAGAVLCGLGFRVLWASRKPGGRRYLRRGLIALLALVLFFEVVLPVGVAIVATNRARTPVQAVDLGRPAQEVRLRTADGLTLAGAYVPSLNGAAVITFPREWTARQARLLADAGYGVLLLDMRGYGDSEGDVNRFGWGSTADVDAAVAWLRARPDVVDGRVGGFGSSVGGEQMIEAAAGNAGLRAVASEGAGERSVRETLLYGVRAAPSLPMAAVQTAAVAVLSGDAPPPSLDELARRISPRSLFLIYAGEGGGGEELQPHYFAAAGEPKAIWRVERAGHTAGLSAAPEEYERRLIQFFDGALLGT